MRQTCTFCIKLIAHRRTNSKWLWSTTTVSNVHMDPHFRWYFQRLCMTLVLSVAANQFMKRVQGFWGSRGAGILKILIGTSLCGGHYIPPPDWNRVNLSAKTWWEVPTFPYVPPALEETDVWTRDLPRTVYSRIFLRVFFIASFYSSIKALKL